MGEARIVPYIESGQHKTWFEIHVSARTRIQEESILILHRPTDTVEAWQRWSDRLGDHRIIHRGYPVIAQVGNQRPLAQTLEAMATDLVSFLREFGIGSINLMGIGCAASHALATAALYPDRVRSIVIGGAPDHLPSPAPKRSRSEGKLEFLGNASSVELDGILPEVLAPALVMAPMQDGPASVEYQVNLADLLPSATLLPVNATQEDVLQRPSEDCIAAVRRFIATPPSRS
jgi:pimeloyl-ACP methyl ester carboxylesterase